jgi:GMP synthase-like glutamine amidotransferase
MRVHVFQHVPFEDLGSIRDWLNSRGAEVRYTRFYAGEPLPVLEEIDMLIAMGGPMSANDEADLPWLKAEKQALREAIVLEKSVLGVCLGAQLIASALGARVYHNAVKEIGWFPIQGVHGAEPAFSFPAESRVFHWHGETFDLPQSAVHLASSVACTNQAFQFKRHVMGLQFHLEMTVDGLRALVENCRSELTGGPYVQRESELIAIPESHYMATNELMTEILTYLVDSRANQALHPTAVDVAVSGCG